MRKSLILVLLLTVLLTACGKEEIIKHKSSETFTAEEIVFKKGTDAFVRAMLGEKEWDKIVIDTKTETLVAYYTNTSFYKKKDAKESTVVKITTTWKDEYDKPKEEINYKVYLTPKDIKKVSKLHANYYGQTLQFASEEIPTKEDK